MERRVQLWQGEPQTPLFLPGPGAEPQRKVLTTHYAPLTQSGRRQGCFNPRLLTDYKENASGRAASGGVSFRKATGYLIVTSLPAAAER